MCVIAVDVHAGASGSSGWKEKKEGSVLIRLPVARLLSWARVPLSVRFRCEYVDK